MKYTSILNKLLKLLDVIRGVQFINGDIFFWVSLYSPMFGNLKLCLLDLVEVLKTQSLYLAIA